MNGAKIEITDAIRKSIGNYRKVGIEISVSEDKVFIKQVSLFNGYILNNQQLYERAKGVFRGQRTKIVVQVYRFNPEDVTIKWIEEKMTEFGLSRKDLINQLALDKSRVSLYFSDGRGLTNTIKAAFFYYFLTYELNRDLRAELSKL